MTTHLEVKTIEHKGIKVSYMIDYDRGMASLVEPQSSESHARFPWKTKDYFFSNRGLEYMNGWQNILEAMQIAVEECKRALEKDLAGKRRIKEKLFGKVMEESNKV